ncbi:KamA family radical SAM protein [bacterium]|nr:KamA family radical SAM protein [candidate division CSSED10-310 bacterium]
MESPVDWRWQMAQADEVARRLEPPAPVSFPSFPSFPTRATPHVLSLIRKYDYTDPIFAQVIPRPEETVTMPEEMVDPTGDVTHCVLGDKHPLLVHRYPDRVLLIIGSPCPMHCRFCFRRPDPRDAGNFTAADMEALARYLLAHSEVHEVVITGGDPLSLPDERLGGLLEDIHRIPQIRTIRIHTRMITANPFRFTSGLLSILANSAVPLWLVAHINHANELTGDHPQMIRELMAVGVPVLSQSVLLHGVNDDRETLRDLFLSLIEMRIKPYYLHHPDPVPGTAHFRIPPDMGLRLFKSLRGSIPGYALPTYVLDVPGGYGKVPLCPGHLIIGAGGTMIEALDGRLHTYPKGREQA